jgi:hypothetical protein
MNIYIIVTVNATVIYFLFIYIEETTCFDLKMGHLQVLKVSHIYLKYQIVDSGSPNY